MHEVLTDRSGPVWRLCLNRPPVNPIDLTLVRALADQVADAAADPTCRAVVLTGAGRAFSAGIDTKRVPAYDASTRAEMLQAINRTVLALYGLPKPTVAAINGHALGGGLVVALACDFRLAARGEYKLGLTEVTAGIPYPAAPMVVVQSELEPARVRVLGLSGVIFKPDEPFAQGVIDRLVAPESLLDDATHTAERLAAASAYATVKQQIRAAALARMRHIVEHNDEPLLGGWIVR